MRLSHSWIVPPVNAVQPGRELKLSQRPGTEDASNDPFSSRLAPAPGGEVTGGEVTGGTGGEDTASTLTLNGDDAELVLPAASVAFALRLCVPVDSWDVATLQAPIALAFAVPI